MKTAKLANIADIQTGPFGSQLHKEDYVDSGTPIVTVEHLGRRKLSNKNVPFVSESDAHRLSKYSLEQGDIVFSRVGSVDRCSQVSENEAGWLFSGRCLRVRPIDPLIDPDYLYYFLTLPKTQEFIRAIAVGATMPSINTSLLGEVDIDLPPLSEQVGIAKVLGALDEKIAANQLAIHKIQELLHAQWHAITNTGISSTEPISSIAEVNPRTSKPQSDECSFLEMKDLPEYGLIVDRWGKRETKGGTKFRNGDVLLARITPCFENGKMAIVDFLEDDEVGMGSTEYIIFRPKEDIPVAAIHAIISSPEFRGFGYKALTGTSGRQRIAADDLKEIAVPWPSESALTEYRQLADVLLKKATALRNENQVLARTRDELLPLLISGRITVGEAEDAADEAASES
ncbi:restriction endonuclease subunit S [Corynebacterium pseudogenitalium]|uniref:Restriction endonuclease subunit S n=1 Tax=Corynebacterium pseudogenitalium TaxID=38303 RepID=A0ABD4TUY7_9CORY|nr:restriction endonuclease subunit S [Corynebacterium pseudogenitalium]MCQ4615054.1 restriction endonuclease subunit S [Corynebacterium pseudogenitalium]